MKNEEFTVFGVPEGPEPAELTMAKMQLVSIIDNIKLQKGQAYSDYIQILANGKMMADLMTQFVATLHESGAPMPIIGSFMVTTEKVMSIFGVTMAAYRRNTSLPETQDEGGKNTPFCDETWATAERINKLVKVPVDLSAEGQAKAKARLDSLIAAEKLDGEAS